MDSTLNLFGIADESIVDGDGIRFVIFTQGCPHHCPGCHNPGTHDFSRGQSVTIGKLLRDIAENPLLSGVTFSGGEPFCQPEPLAKLAAAIHRLGLDVTVYTGYTLEELLAMASPAIRALLDQADVLVDGKYIEAERDLTLRFRGSANQRVIDMNATRMKGEISLLED